MKENNKWEIKARVYKLTKDYNPPYRQLRSKHTHKSPLLYLDEDKGMNRELRYASNQNSPFVDEQTGYVIPSHIAFLDGMIISGRGDIALQKFLEVHPDNVANGGHVFFEHKPDATAADDIVDFEDKTTAFLAVKDADVDLVEALAFHEIGDQAFSLSIKELRRDLFIVAEEDPSYLLGLLNDDYILLKALGKKAEKFDVIKLDESKTAVKWGANGRKICNIPVDKSPWEAFADYLLTDEGHEVKAKVKEKLKNF